MEAPVSQAARFLVALALVTLLPAEAVAGWTRLRSANFEFIGDAPAAQIRRVAQQLEQFREAMVRALPRATAASPVPTIVMVFATDRSLTPVKPLFRGNTVDIGGYYRSGDDRNYIAINGEYIDFALQTVFHEYAHALTGNSLGSAPAWVNEGLAEFYEVVQTLDGGKSIVIGRAPAQHVELLKGSTLMPIKELLAIDHSSPAYNEGVRRGVFYAQSWALVHYLVLGNKERAPQFSKYLAGLRSGTSPLVAFAEAFGSDTTTLDRELFDYVRQFAFPALRLDFGERIGGQADRGADIDDLQAQIHVADLQARMGREDEARASLTRILERRPNTALASTVLGLIDLRARRLTDALPLLERAASQGQDDAFVQASYGRALIALLSEESNTENRAALVRKARVPLSRAIEIDAGSAVAASLLGYVELVDGTDMPRAIAMLERAAQLAPSRQQYRMMLAQALIRNRQYQEATKHLGPLLAEGGSEAIRNDARRLLAIAGNGLNAETEKVAAPAEIMRLEPPDAIPGLPVSTSRSTSTPASSARVRLDLRPLQNGETRVLAFFRSIECLPGGVVLHFDADGKTLRLAAKALSEVDFVTYLSEPPGSVSCGALPKPQRALATYRARPGAATPNAADGDAVAIELVPDEF